MAQNNRREIELALSITTANADALSKLQQDVKGLAKEGGDAAPAFQKLADELGQLAAQAKQLTALEGLTQELQTAAAAQAEAAAKSGALKQTLVELTTATDAARAAFIDTIKPFFTASFSAANAISLASSRVSTGFVFIVAPGESLINSIFLWKKPFCICVNCTI